MTVTQESSGVAMTTDKDFERSASRMREAILEFTDSVAKASSVTRPQPTTQSIETPEGSFDGQSQLHREALRMAIDTSRLLLEFGYAHIRAFATTKGVVSLSCARSMLESCALARWILAPDIDDRERVGRAYAHQYAGVQSQVKFCKTAGLVEEERKSIDYRSEILQTAETLNYKVLKNKKQERYAIHKTMPSATELIEMLLCERRTYAVLSAVVHGHPWAIAKALFRETEGPEVVVEGVRLAQVERHDSPGLFVWSGQIVTEAYAKAVWTAGIYLGWDQSALMQALEGLFDRLELREETQFWRLGCTPNSAVGRA